MVVHDGNIVVVTMVVMVTMVVVTMFVVEVR